jgi:hypothetical protein
VKEASGLALHTASTLIVAATGQLWSRLTFRHKACNVPGHFSRNARYVQVHIHEAYAAIRQSIRNGTVRPHPRPPETSLGDNYLDSHRPWLEAP